MIDTPRISIRDKNDIALAYMDNSLKNSMHYFDEAFHTYLAGAQYTLEFSVLTSHPDSEHLKEGNHLSFRHDGKDAYFTIVVVERGEYTTNVVAFGLTLELTNEDKQPEKIENSTFAERWSRASPDLGDIRLNVNEVAGQTRSWEFTGTESFLKRLYAIANQFDAEIEFVCHLNSDYSLDHYDLNVYKQHDETHQGMGSDRSAEIVRYGTDISGITRTIDISELYTSIKPYGKDDMTLTNYNGHKVYDSDGRLHYECNGLAIHNVQARQLFPSTLKASSDKYAQKFLKVDTDSQDVLWSTAFRELKKISEPKVSYKVDGYVTGCVGDTVTIEDGSYSPPMYLQCRIVEQEVCWTDPSKSKTTFDNFTEVNSEISDSLYSQMQKLVAEYQTYQVNIISSAGIIFKVSSDSTTLTAHVIGNDGTDVSDEFTFAWTKSGTDLATTKAVTVTGQDFEVPTVYGVKAYKDGKQRGYAEVTVSHLSDGAMGPADYLHVKWSDDGGQTFTANSGTTPGAWMGMYHSSDETDSTDPTDYMWVKVKGDQGDKGDSGQSLVGVGWQYYLSTSNTTQTGGTIRESIPDFDSTKYLWRRWKAVYENPDSVAYSPWELDPLWSTTGSAVTEANKASQSASDAVTAATDAVSKAQSALDGLAPLQKGIDEAKAAAQEAKDDVAAKTQQILADISGTYATKSDVTDIEGSLQTQITANATAIQSKVSQTEYQQNQADIDDQLTSLNTDLTAAKKNLSDLQSDQSEAATHLAKAQADLAAAQADLDDLEADQTATQAQLETAKQSLSAAQAAVQKAQADVDSANAQIEQAKGEITALQTDVEALTSRVTTAETSITQNSDAIKLEASRREESLSQSKSYTDAQIDIASDRILSTVSDSYLTHEDGEEIKQWTTSSISQSADSVRIELNSGLQTLSDQTDERLSNYDKYFNFGQDGLKIGDKETNSYTQIDTDGQTIVANGQTAASFLAGGMESPRITTKELDIGLRIVVLESGEVMIY